MLQVAPILSAPILGGLPPGYFTFPPFAVVTSTAQTPAGRTKRRRYLVRVGEQELLFEDFGEAQRWFEAERLKLEQEAAVMKTSQERRRHKRKLTATSPQVFFETEPVSDLNIEGVTLADALMFKQLPGEVVEKAAQAEVARRTQVRQNKRKAAALILTLH